MDLCRLNSKDSKNKGNARLLDLCAEDKTKIGKLITEMMEYKQSLEKINQGSFSVINAM